MVNVKYSKNSILQCKSYAIEKYSKELTYVEGQAVDKLAKIYSLVHSIGFHCPSNAKSIDPGVARIKLKPKLFTQTGCAKMPSFISKTSTFSKYCHFRTFYMSAIDCANFYRKLVIAVLIKFWTTAHSIVVPPWCLYPRRSTSKVCEYFRNYI